MSFSDFGLAKPLLRAINESGYTEPTPIQASAIPPILSGRDIIATAKTGTGKTAGFTLPLLQRMMDLEPARSKMVHTLILAPTRELAAQIGKSVADYGRHLTLRSLTVFGGVSIQTQVRPLQKGVDILIATPGRLLDLQRQGAVNLSKVGFLVLDEADRMLDMGFIPDIQRITQLLPKERQNLMFSATFSQEIRDLGKKFLNNPVRIDVSPANATADNVNQSIYQIDKPNKGKLLVNLLREGGHTQVLIFSRTKHGADKLTRVLKQENIKASAIHGNKTQAARKRALQDFTCGKLKVLVATDIASRGLDIKQLPLVVNYDLPYVPEDYVHRIGRTGRAGATGQAISLVTLEERKQLHAIETLTGKKLDKKDVPGMTIEFPAHKAKKTKARVIAHKKAATHKKPNANSKARRPQKGMSAKPGRRSSGSSSAGKSRFGG